EAAGRSADPVEIVGRREPGLRLQRPCERGGRLLGLDDSLRRLSLAQLGQSRAPLGQVPAPGALLGHLAERRERRRLAHRLATPDRVARVVEREPAALGVGHVRAQIDPPGSERLRGDDPHHLLRGRGEGRSRLRRSEEHTSELQSRENLVCRLLLEKKKKKTKYTKHHRDRKESITCVLRVSEYFE